MEERHRRELRRQRTDELRTGLAALAGAYRDRAVAGTLSPARAAEAVALIDGLSADLGSTPGSSSLCRPSWCASTGWPLL